jgi:hypothetical protein
MQAAPGMQQHPAAPPQGSPSPGMAPSSTAEQTDQGMQRHHTMGSMRGHTRRHAQGQMHHGMHRGGMARRESHSSDNVANQLNAQEAQRLSGGTMPMQGSMPMQGGMPMHGGMQMQGAPAQRQPQPGSAPSSAPMR